ncbi:MAG: LytTR family DNA-binding domain-containing protein [Caulobacterales bacterium]|jgi:DNA-binding LytR/AlgR family response regulator
MEDHYVRVHRANASTLELASMRAAIVALGAREGLQTHRSWWVARDAVAGIQEDGRAATIRLTNGLTAPVARNTIAALRAAGWLAIA